VIAEMPEPEGFSESLEQYVARCGLYGGSCTCMPDKDLMVYTEGKVAVDRLPRTGHAVTCPIGQAYLAWKRVGQAHWQVIKDKVLEATRKMNLGDYEPRERRGRRQ